MEKVTHPQHYNNGNIVISPVCSERYNLIYKAALRVLVTLHESLTITLSKVKRRLKYMLTKNSLELLKSGKCCPDCNSKSYSSYGSVGRKNGTRKQRYKCKECSRCFADFDTSFLLENQDEEWLSIPQYEDKYLISNYGRVFSFTTRSLIKTGSRDGNYLQVMLWRDRKAEGQYIHRLVASLFCVKHESNERLIVNHKDGNKRNNQSSNLEWCTYSRNILHAYDNGLMNIEIPEICKPADLTPRERVAIVNLSSNGVSICTIAKSFNCSEELIEDVKSLRYSEPPEALQRGQN